MADSWGLVIVLVFLAAFVCWILKLFIEYPGLLHLHCVYAEDNAQGETLFQNFRMDKLRESVRARGHPGRGRRSRDPAHRHRSPGLSSSSYSCQSPRSSSRSRTPSDMSSENFITIVPTKQHKEVKIAETKIYIDTE